MIEVRGLSKRYGEKLAVNNLSFDVVPGKVTGFLGPNGAGKTTTMRLMLGLDYPNAGTVTIDGKQYAHLANPMREVGALLDAKAVHGGRSAYNHLLCLAQTNNLPKRRVGEVLELVGLADVARKRTKGFSLGMSQRLGIAGTLLGDPKVLMFDEPVNGLDPDVGDGAHRGSADRDRPGSAARRVHHGRVHRPQLRADRPGGHAPA
jgi:ABC-2 type transport system ATP-binding protein